MTALALGRHGRQCAVLDRLSGAITTEGGRPAAAFAEPSRINLVHLNADTAFFDNAIKAGAQILYTAMFDEINEGTAIFKLAADPSQEPVGTDLLSLDAHGCRTATSDMYLRLAGQATRALKEAQ